MCYLSFDALKGLTLTSVVNNNNEEIVFTTEDGRVFKLYHAQDCCESVYVDDIVGDLDFLVGTPILMADEVSCGDEPPPQGDYSPGSYTWTFYKLGTVKGYVDIRWYGSSNGYYSESVTFAEVRA